VLDYRQLFALDQGAARGLRVTVRDPAGRPVELVGSPFHVAGAELPPPAMPPRLGQDTAEVLTGLLGLDAASLDDLRRQGVI
jgi:crotonobetainyl-CoA:carnitine CoA-transferase CaiB-like acyl-CoA transferase